ncbi:MAG TPA: hypothetical protein VH325_15115 [Bryobacteraceae bacterium]|nr:hypothetical protein [Bryobacteraceae bacterium]
MPSGIGQLRRLLPITLFAVSTGVSLVLSMLLVASHTPYLAQPGSLQAFAGRLGEGGLGDAGRGSWRAVHLLAAGCACSRGVAEHLVSRGLLPGAREQVVFAGASPDLAGRLRHAGFRVYTMSQEDIVLQFGIVAAPLLVIISPQDRIRYAGGYTPGRDARTGYQDVAIWRQTVAGRDVAELPIYGCAVGHRLQRSLDPLGLKYQ